MKQKKIYNMVLCAVFAAVICVIAPHSIPIGPISLTAGVMAVAFTSAVLGWKRGTITVILYILIGAAGAPVFSNYGGGIGKILGITGGYITGYIPMSLAIGFAADVKCKKGLKALLQAAGSVLGLLVFYMFAMAHYMLVTKSSLMTSFTVTVMPFILIDALKVLAANMLGGAVRRALSRAGLM